jgi:DNA-binding IclR family transcriptional regulator
MDKENNFQVPNLERGLQILEFLVGNDCEFSLSALARELGFPSNSVMRIMHALEHYGYVLRNPESKRYILSNKMVTMTAGRASQRNLMEQSMDVMRQIRDEIGETVVIGVMDDNEGLILEQVQGLHPFRFVCEPGTRQAMHASSSTKSILAFMDEAECECILKKIKFARLTDHSIPSLKAFRKELLAVKKNGYALDRAEALEGVHCVGAPILDSRGQALAAITVTGPAYRMKSKELDRIGVRVRDHVLKISKRMGFGL